MEKKYLAFVLALAGVLAMSCKKDYTCNCTGVYKEEWIDKDNDQKDDFFSSESPINFSINIKDKKKNAEAQCSGLDASTSSTSEITGYTIYRTRTVNCTLTKK